MIFDGTEIEVGNGLEALAWPSIPLYNDDLNNGRLSCPENDNGFDQELEVAAISVQCLLDLSSSSRGTKVRTPIYIVLPQRSDLNVLKNYVSNSADCSKNARRISNLGHLKRPILSSCNSCQPKPLLHKKFVGHSEEPATCYKFYQRYEFTTRETQLYRWIHSSVDGIRKCFWYLQFRKNGNDASYHANYGAEQKFEKLKKRIRPHCSNFLRRDGNKIKKLGTGRRLVV